MSQNSEGKQNNQISQKMEEEEMAQELMSMEMYEVGMGYEQMKQILRFINESRNMAGIEPKTLASQEATKYSQELSKPEAVTKNNSLHDLMLEEKQIPKPSFSYRSQSGRNSPTTSGRKSAMENSLVEEMSVASPNMFEEPQRSSTEDESLFDKLAKESEIADAEESLENRSQLQGRNARHILSDSSPSNSPNSQSVEMKIENVKSRKNQRIERWKLDPTNSVVDDNDVPLQPKTRPVLNERVPYSFCHHKKVLDANIGEKVLSVLTYAIEEVADIWRRKHRSDVSEFQWGSPIKVGTNNVSLDKNPVIEEVDLPQRFEISRRDPDSVQRRNVDRNCKRKAMEHIKDLVNDQIDSDEDSDSIFEKIKKPKTTDKLWEPFARSNVNSSEQGLTRQKKMFNNLNTNKVELASVIGEYDSDDFDNDNLNSLHRKNRKKDEQTSRTSSPEVYPRRIIPPNPSKPRAVRRPRKNGEEKAKRKSPVRKNVQATLEKKKNPGVSAAKGRDKNAIAKQTDSQIVTLNDDEIINELENDSEENDDKVVIKPLQVKGLTGKLQHGMSLLLETKKAEERTERAKIQEQRKLQMEAKMAREDVQITRYLKEKEEQQKKEAREIEIKAKEETWRRNEAIRDRDRRRRFEQNKKRSAEAGKGSLLTDSDEGDEILHSIDMEQRSLAERVQCPICQLEFSKDEIQGHAADCNQFDNLDEPGPSLSPANNDELAITNENEIFDCNICSHYSTTDGILYNEHVNKCMNSKRNEAETDNRLGSPAGYVVEVPTSPIRSYSAISRLTESAINYAEQFGDQKGKPNVPKIRRRR